jgi:hypothetical protein
MGVVARGVALSRMSWCVSEQDIDVAADPDAMARMSYR